MPINKREYKQEAAAYMALWQQKLDAAEAYQIALMVKQWDKNVIKVL